MLSIWTRTAPRSGRVSSATVLPAWPAAVVDAFLLPAVDFFFPAGFFGDFSAITLAFAGNRA
jgi:hypothetical protein